MAQVWKFMADNRATLITIAAFVGTAFASTVPEERPKSLDDFWAWFRDFVHQVGNAKRPTVPQLKGQ